MEYFEEGMLDLCDTLLRLDDGEGSPLPVHSQILATRSPVFRGMLGEGLFANASPSEKVVVPFGDCTREEAISFLSVMYPIRIKVDESAALSVARLGHKYGAETVVMKCDDVLAKLAGFDQLPGVLSSYLKGKSSEEFVHILECAIAFDMPKLLACCECHIAASNRSIFKPVPSALLPISSTLRIAEGLRKAVRKMSFEDFGQGCECACCERNREGGEYTCECCRQEIEDEDKFMPCPKDFLDMAQRKV